jgi:hypothetical protein
MKLHGTDGHWGSWQKARASEHSDGCVEVSEWIPAGPLEIGYADHCGMVAVRDSHDHAKVVQVPRWPDFALFIQAVKGGEFDRFLQPPDYVLHEMTPEEMTRRAQERYAEALATLKDM